MPQAVWSWFYPAGKWPLTYTPPDNWRVNPAPPIPDPPYDNYWYPGQPHESQPWTSKAIGAFPPSKIHMAENLVSVPPFGVAKVNQFPVSGTVAAHKSWIKLRMLGQLTPFFIHIFQRKENGEIDYTTRQVVKVKPKRDMRQWNKYANDLLTGNGRVDRPKPPNGNPDLFA
jgi:hypothetical protein